MVPITKEERNLLLKKYPDLCIARTMKQDSKRRHYYCEERPGAMAYLEKIRMRRVVFDTRYPDGLPQKRDDNKSSRNNAQRGKNSKQNGRRR